MNGEEIKKINLAYIESSLSNPANNLPERIHRIIWKYENDDTKYKTC